MSPPSEAAGARLEPLALESALEAARRAGVPEPLARLNVFRLLLHQPRLAKAVADLLLSQLFGGRLDDRLRELVIMRIGWATNASYEWGQHWPIALQRGCTAEELQALAAWRDASVFGPAERAVLAATDETLATGTISDATWAACRAHVGDTAACLEVVSAIGTWRMISQLVRSLGVPLEEGLALWPPDGRGPAA